MACQGDPLPDSRPASLDRVGEDSGFRTLFEHSPVPQVLVFPGVVGMRPNAAFADLFRIDSATLATLPYDTLVHPDCFDDFRRTRDEFDAGIAAGRRTMVAERIFLRGDGTTFVGRASLHAFTDAAGNHEFTVAAIEDISEQRRAEEALRASEARFRALVDNSPDIIAVVQADGSFTGSDGGTRLLGYPKGYDIGVFDLIHPEDVERARDALTRIIAGTRRSEQPIELRLRAMSGEYFDFECVAANMGDHDAVRGIVVTARNITERKRIERELVAARAQFEAVFEHAPLVVSLVDMNGTILDINYAGCQLLGRTRQELIGTPADACTHPDDKDRVIEATTRQLGGSEETLEFRLVNADGGEVWVMSNASLIDPGGDDEPYVVTMQADISEQRRLQERLALEATRDPLTGVYNRGAFMTELELMLNRRNPNPIGLLFIDLDRFKQVNDTLGHDAGDAVLATIARRMQDCVRAGDVVARLGGDEFVVLCDEVTSLEEAEAVAERVRATTDRPIEVRGLPVEVGASVGVVIGRSGDNPAELMRAADAATYRAKQNGRGRVEIAHHDAA